jgi:hypothetical protein
MRLSSTHLYSYLCPIYAHSGYKLGKPLCGQNLALYAIYIYSYASYFRAYSVSLTLTFVPYFYASCFRAFMRVFMPVYSIYLAFMPYAFVRSCVFLCPYALFVLLLCLVLPCVYIYVCVLCFQPYGVLPSPPLLDIVLIVNIQL